MGYDVASDGPTESRPLDGIRVVDVGTALAGPVCATILGEFGADVIKVEHPVRGDPLRSFGPSIDGVPLWWMIEGRNKKSITLDIGCQAGQALLRRLVERCDVLVENFRPGTMARWNLSRDALADVNPRLVYVSVSGFGQTGPYAPRGAYDRVAQAMAGLTYVTGHPDQPPVKPGLGITDYTTAIVAALGAMLALYERDGQGSGRGQQVDASLAESLLRMYHYYLPQYQRLGVVPERTGNMAEAMAPAECFPAADGVWLMIAAGTDRTFQLLAEAMGQPELADDKRFRTNVDRTTNHVELHATIADWVAGRDAAEVRQVLDAAGVPVAPLYTARDISEDAHFRAREAVTTVTDPVLGDVDVQGIVPHLTRTPGRITSTGPARGAHNEEVYGGLLGLSAGELTALRADNVI